jgi:hypothetical protein
LKLILLIIFFPLVFWFYGTILSIGLLLALFAIQFIEAYKVEILSSLLALGVIYLMAKLNLARALKDGLIRRHKKIEIKRGWNETKISLSNSSLRSSSNLYCYWCSRKLGVKSWEKGAKYYCDVCYSILTNEPLS